MIGTGRERCHKPLLEDVCSVQRESCLTLVDPTYALNSTLLTRENKLKQIILGEQLIHQVVNIDHRVCEVVFESADSSRKYHLIPQDDPECAHELARMRDKYSQVSFWRAKFARALSEM